jgi:beta-mannanase
MSTRAWRLLALPLVSLMLLLTVPVAHAQDIIGVMLPLNYPASQAQVVPRLGMWLPSAPGDERPIAETEALLGRDIDIVHWFQAWGSATNAGYRADNVARVHALGATPLITWEPWVPGQGVDQPNYSLKAIALGKHDAYIRAWAKAARASGGPIMLRFAHEMNGNWYPWAAGVNGNTAGDYVRAWKRVRAIFARERATNVQLVWSPNVEYPGSTPLQQLYPGDADVDWVGMDGYNWGTERQGSVWRSLNTTFGATYAKLAGMTSRPMMIAETASSEAGGDKAAWIREGLSLSNLRANFPRVQAVVWFNEQKSGNWPIQTSAAATLAFVETVNGWR